MHLLTIVLDINSNWPTLRVFLANYQNWSGLDSTKLIATLSNVNIAQNTSITSDNLTMSINHTNASTAIRWV